MKLFRNYKKEIEQYKIALEKQTNINEMLKKSNTELKDEIQELREKLKEQVEINTKLKHNKKINSVETTDNILKNKENKNKNNKVKSKYDNKVKSTNIKNTKEDTTYLGYSSYEAYKKAEQETCDAAACAISLICNM